MITSFQYHPENTAIFGLPEGVVRLALAGGLQVSTVRMDKVFRDPAVNCSSASAAGTRHR
jgi:hypothetical protein